MGYGIKILIKGDYALFSRPELKVERVSYDVPTPGALVGLISAVYWHTGVKYIIDKIYVYNPINFVNVRRNEVSQTVSLAGVEKQMKGGDVDLSIYTKECIAQRASLLLKDVCYGVEAHFVLNGEEDESMTEEKCYNILSRRLRNGQYFNKPCLGCREFPADVTLVDALPDSTLSETVDLGYMLYDLVYTKGAKGAYSNSATPRFYRPKMINGVIDVRLYAKELLC